MRKYSLLLVGALCAVLWQGAASAELTLWLKYHYAAEEAFLHGDYTRAETLFLAAERESKITLPEKNFRLASTLDGLGRVYAAQDRLDEANTQLTNALEMKREVLGPHTREVPKTVVNLADLRYAERKPLQAERLYRQALLILVRDQTNLQVTNSLNGLSKVCMDQGKITEAETLLERARRIHVEADRRRHPAMGLTLANLARVMHAQDKLDQAQELFGEATGILAESLGEAHPALAACLEDFAVVAGKLGDKKEKCKLSDWAAKVRKNFKCANHPELLEPKA